LVPWVAWRVAAVQRGWPQESPTHSRKPSLHEDLRQRNRCDSTCSSPSLLSQRVQVCGQQQRQPAAPCCLPHLELAWRRPAAARALDPRWRCRLQRN
jgi:hypothetical protein